MEKSTKTRQTSLWDREVIAPIRMSEFHDFDSKYTKVWRFYQALNRDEVPQKSQMALNKVWHGQGRVGGGKDNLNI